MHELGVTFSVMDTLEEVAKKNNVSRISKVTLQVGEVSTVIPHYLTDCWKWAANKRHLFKESELVIKRGNAVTQCQNCKNEYPTVKYGKICPKCGSENTYLIKGNEFVIKEIEAQ